MEERNDSVEYRAFIAIPLPTSILKKLAIVSDELSSLKKSRRVKMSIPPVSNIHLTLQFLGDIGKSMVSELDIVMKRCLNEISNFDLCVQGVGAFPNLDRPRIVWAGLAENPALIELQKAIVENLAQLPLKIADKNYKPHLTLARVKHSPRKVIAGKLQPYLAEEFGEFGVDEVVLYRSHLLPSGAQYSPLATWSLALDANNVNQEVYE